MFTSRQGKTEGKGKNDASIFKVCYGMMTVVLRFDYEKITIRLQSWNLVAVEIYKQSFF